MYAVILRSLIGFFHAEGVSLHSPGRAAAPWVTKRNDRPHPERVQLVVAPFQGAAVRTCLRPKVRVRDPGLWGLTASRLSCGVALCFAFR